MQPTDVIVRSVFAFWEREGREEDRNMTPEATNKSW